MSKWWEPPASPPARCLPPTRLPDPCIIAAGISPFALDGGRFLESREGRCDGRLAPWPRELCCIVVEREMFDRLAERQHRDGKASTLREQEARRNSEIYMPRFLRWDENGGLPY